MREQEVFIKAEKAFNNVVQQIADDQWNMEIPADFAMSQTETDRKMTLRDIIDYHAYDDAWVPDMLKGLTMDEAGQEKFKGDLLKDNPKANFKAIVDKACAAAEKHDDPDRTVHCSFGDFPAREYFWQINSFRALRANDIARLIGIDRTLPEDLVQGIWDEISPHAEEWRSIGVYGPEVKVPESASLQDKLLGLTGRQP